MACNQSIMDWNATQKDKSFSWEFDYLSMYYDRLPLTHRIKLALLIIQKVYYPLLAFVGVPANLVTIVILSRENCGLSKCVTCYLVAMAVADLLVVILDLILRHIPIVYWYQFTFIYSIPLCNVHAVLIFATTDCSVWFTVSFTFDRFVTICCQKLKIKYCTQKSAAVVLGTVTMLSCLKNITWFFAYAGEYRLQNFPWFCYVTINVGQSLGWAVIELLHYIVTPAVPFLLILLLNVLTIRHILMANKSRKRLRAHSSGENPGDPEMEIRRKSIILLFVISGNFIFLWSVFVVNSIWSRMWDFGVVFVRLPDFVQELGFMLQLLSCCTNTYIYVVTQTKFREQLKNVGKYPFTLFVKLFK
ncbi:probable G-protein coupled receptor 139 [Scyliorhinus canicula]|uniref:probable G-protein coupled receptor 139 n=1 Tax=Scyliorhinus canicula TaxID=7830 RepID=UPI0018F5DF5C|nr:probable G-protein coupled receptor 139 [Scyliorhinus canicula]